MPSPSTLPSACRLRSSGHRALNCGQHTHQLGRSDRPTSQAGNSPPDQGKPTLAAMHNEDGDVVTDLTGARGGVGSDPQMPATRPPHPSTQPAAASAQQSN